MGVSLNTFTPNTQIESAKVNTNFTNLSAAIRPTLTFTVVGTLTTGTDVVPSLIIPKGLTIEKVYAYVKTPPVGASIILDINLNGTTIWATQGNRVTIEAAANLGTSANFDTASLTEEDVITLDIDQIGSSTAGADLTIEIKCS